MGIANFTEGLILDSFAGSGTTAHAVLAQNAADGGKRRFILIEMEQYASSLTAERVRRVIGGYQNSKSADKTEQVAGLGGGFRYCTLGETLFDEYGQLQADASFTVLARHVFFTETRQPLPANWQANGSRLGVVDSTEVHLLLEDLDLGWLEALPEFAGLRVVYANRCLLSSVTLEAAGLVFRQIPYQVRVA